MEILGKIIFFVIAGALLFVLWKSSMEMVDNKILDIQLRARKEGSRIKPWLLAIAQNRFWFIAAMAFAPLLVIGYGLYLIVVVFSYEIGTTFTDGYKSLQRKRALRR